MSVTPAPTVPRRRSRFRRALAVIAALLAVALLSLGLVNSLEASRLDHPLTASLLSDTELAQAAAISQVKLTTGNQLWPGFADAPVPFILFNDRYEFLLGTDVAPTGWEPVPESLFAGRPYFRRIATNPQAFAVPLDAGWAGSMSTLARVDRDIYLLLRQDTPLGLGKLVPHAMVRIEPGLFRSMLMHETFHAFQAVSAPDRFAGWRAFYRGQERYPYDDAAFRSAWDEEGKLLSQALDEPDLARVRDLVREFLAVRTQRRAAVSANADLLSFERDVEWLEGLAKYAEIRTYELVEGKSLAELRQLRFWQTDFRTLASSLGSPDHDQRFYLSGMAMARLLDRLDPTWKEHALADGVYLEDLLRAAAGL